MAPSTDEQKPLTSAKKLPVTLSDTNVLDKLPKSSLNRMIRHNVDLSRGYPEFPKKQLIYLDEAEYRLIDNIGVIERGTMADPEKRALFQAAKQVRNLSAHIGTEIIGLQLADLTNTQLDELALLISERGVVFFREQDLSPKRQLEMANYFGKAEIHPHFPHVPGFPGVNILWPHLTTSKVKSNFKNPFGTAAWHADGGIAIQSYVQLHNDCIPSVGGDTVWSSGYGAYEKLSPAMQKFLEGKYAVHESLETYLDREDISKGPQKLLRERLIVFTHPVTGWKCLYVNKRFTKRIVGLEEEESNAILNVLFNIFEKNLDLQVRFNWQPTTSEHGTTAIWDDRTGQHYAVWDYEDKEPRHGTRISTMTNELKFDPDSLSRRQALGLDHED